MLVTVQNIGGINFMPATELEEVVQNVRMVLATMQGTVPLDREFGIDGAVVDLPVPAAKSRAAANIVTAINNCEPRVKVNKINFSGDEMIDGVCLVVANVVVDVIEERLRGYSLWN